MTPKPRMPKPEALPAPYPDIEPGDHVYVRHPERGPMAVRVLATGKHGLTATCPMGDLYRVHWERILGVKARMTRKFKLVDNGAEGCILEDDQGQRRYVAHAEDEGDDGEGDKPLHKSQPTPAQIEAGNYKKRHIRFQGLAISIENPTGSVRKSVDRDGHEWRTKMVHAYGYIRGSKGVDKDHVDCYIGPNPDARHAYIVHQRKAGQWDRYDEDKVMLGFDTEAQAKAAYLKHYDDPRFLGPVTAMPMDEFKRKALATANSPKMIKSFPDHARALFLKAHVKAHTRQLASGKVAAVTAYTDKRRDRDDRTGDLFAEADRRAMEEDRKKAEEETRKATGDRLPPSMPRDAAEKAVSGTALTISLFHGTGLTESGHQLPKAEVEKRISAIKKEGFKVAAISKGDIKSGAANGRQLGDGVYFAENKEHANRYGDVIEVKVKVNKIWEGTYREWITQYGRIQREAKKEGYYEGKSPSERIAFWAKKKGYEGIRQIGIQTVIFDPKKIIVIDDQNPDEASAKTATATKSYLFLKAAA